MEKIKVLIVEDHTMTRLGLQLVVEKSDNLVSVGEAEDGRKAIELAESANPDVILMDIGLPLTDGIEATRIIKEKGLNCKILIYTSRDCDDDVFAALKSGADGYIMKGADELQLVSALTAVAQGIGWLDPAIAKLVLSNIQQNNIVHTVDGNVSAPNVLKYKEYKLTKREYEVLTLITEGLDNNEIADKLVISLSTAKAHVHNILQKLYLKDKHQATAFAHKQGLV